MTREQENAIMDLLWDYLKRDPEHKDRRQTGWGTKTKLGLCACIERIGREGNAHTTANNTAFGDADSAQLARSRG